MSLTATIKNAVDVAWNASGDIPFAIKVIHYTGDDTRQSDGSFSAPSKTYSGTALLMSSINAAGSAFTFKRLAGVQAGDETIFFRTSEIEAIAVDDIVKIEKTGLPLPKGQYEVKDFERDPVGATITALLRLKSA